MIERENVIKGLHDIDAFIAGRLGYEQAKNFLRTIDEAIVLMNRQADVIRCRDCKYYHKNHCLCDDTHYWHREPDWFCADGVK